MNMNIFIFIIYQYKWLDYNKNINKDLILVYIFIHKEVINNNIIKSLIKLIFINKFNLVKYSEGI